MNKILKLRDLAEKKADKRAEKKRELADHAIKTLAQVGYANTSLRDIAAASGLSVGVIHYYFENKAELIAYCVQQYKTELVARFDATVGMAGSPSDIEARFVDGLARSIESDAETHRLWYDIRAQALFDQTFHSVVNEIERSLTELVGRLLARIGLPDADALEVYLAFDSVFRYFLQKRLMGKRNAIAECRAALRHLFAGLHGQPGTAKMRVTQRNR